MKKILNKLNLQSKKVSKANSGITLIALVITIIVMIIIAGVSISFLSNDGIINKAINARELTEIKAYLEQLELSSQEYKINNKYLNNEEITVDGFIDFIKINSEDVSDSKDGKYIIFDDKYIYEVTKKENEDIIDIKYIGKKGNVKPVINKISITDKTVNSIKIDVDTLLSDGATYIYYIKGSDEVDFKKIENSKDSTFEYTKLKNEKLYTIKVEVKAKSSDEIATMQIQASTNTMAVLDSSNTTFSYEPVDWTNGHVKVKIETTVKEYKLQYKTEKTGELGEVENWTDYNEPVELIRNQAIVARVVDSIGQAGNGTATGNVEKIDTKKPIVNVTNSTTNSITFEANDLADTAKEEKSSGIMGYKIQEDSIVPSATASGWESYDGSSKTVNGLTQGKTYYVFVKDSAGNISDVGSKETGSVTISKGNITSSVTNWNGLIATVKFETTTGFYIQTKVGDGNWSANPSVTGSATVTATSGTVVYARLTDSTGQYNAGDVTPITPVLTYSIAYNGNGATGGSMSNSSHNYGTAKNLTANGFEKTAYKFTGWNTKADGSGTSYSDGQSITNLSNENGATITLYAQWVVAAKISLATTSGTVVDGATNSITISGENYGTLSVTSSDESVATASISGTTLNVTGRITSGTKTAIITVNGSNGVSSTYTVTAHKHTGNSSSGGGCYTKANTTTSYYSCSGCVAKTTYCSGCRSYCPGTEECGYIPSSPSSCRCSVNYAYTCWGHTTYSCPGHTSYSTTYSINCEYK